MSKWRGNIINKDARYNTQTTSQARGIYTLDEQLQYQANDDWPLPPIQFQGYGGNTGFRMPVNIHYVDSNGAIPSDSDIDFSIWYDDDPMNNFYSANADAGETGRLYIAVKLNASTTYYNDFCIGAIQFASDDWNQADGSHLYSFTHPADIALWERATVTGFLDSNDPGYENWEDIITAPNQTWVSISAGTVQGRWNISSSTGSGRTGAVDGISINFSADGGNGTLFGGSVSTASQYANAKYAYTESSGSPNSSMANKWFWLRGPEMTLDVEADKRICIAYHAYTHNTAGMVDTAQNPLVRLFWYNGGQD